MIQEKATVVQQQTLEQSIDCKQGPRRLSSSSWWWGQRKETSSYVCFRLERLL